MTDADIHTYCFLTGDILMHTGKLEMEIPVNMWWKDLR